MSAANPLNVFTGPDSIANYYDPDQGPPVPLVEIPEKLNPYRKDGIRIYAKLMSCLPAKNVKSLPALNMLEKSVEKNKTKTVVEYSSGSTILSMSVISRAVHGIDDVRAFLSNKTSDQKLKMMRFFGLRLTLFGGPAQPEALDPRGGIQKAKRLGNEREDVLNPNQYENTANPDAHTRWTGPQILRQLPHINLLAAGLGTSGTLTGIGTYLKREKPSCHILGVVTNEGDRVPGPRSYSLITDITFPWRQCLDSLERVSSYDSYHLSMLLSREGLIVGPSSGFNLQGLFQHIEQRKASNTLDKLRGEDGEIHCVFICCDLPYQYMNEYFTILGEECFPPIENENLQKVDLYRYDSSWELALEEAITRFYDELDYDSGVSDTEGSSTPRSEVSEDDFPSRVPRSKGPRFPTTSTHQLKPSSIMLDLRTSAEFEKFHLPGCTSFPVCATDGRSPFDDAKVLENRWRDLEKAFGGEVWSGALLEGLKGVERVGVVCRDGDTARVAVSILRAKGVTAWGWGGGMEAGQ